MDDLEELKPQNIKVEMERWNISDLKEYISKLESEIKKVKETPSQIIGKYTGAKMDLVFIGFSIRD